MSPPGQEGPTVWDVPWGSRGCGIGGWLRHSVPPAKESSRWEGGQVVQGTLCAGLCPLLAVCPLTSLEGPPLQPQLREGWPGVVEPWVSHGAGLRASECSWDGAELSRESLPGWGCQQEGRGLLQRLPDAAAGGILGLAFGYGGPWLQSGGRPSSSSIPTPSPIGLLPGLDKTFQEELKSGGRRGVGPRGNRLLD